MQLVGSIRVKTKCGDVIDFVDCYCDIDEMVLRIRFGGEDYIFFNHNISWFQKKDAKQ